MDYLMNPQTVHMLDWCIGNVPGCVQCVFDNGNCTAKCDLCSVKSGDLCSGNIRNYPTAYINRK